MEYKDTEIVLTQTSTDSILASEARIIGCMQGLFCNTLKGDILGLVANQYAPTSEELDNVSTTLKNIMCGYTIKENSIAEVIKALAKKEAADKGINPCELECNSHKCHC